MAMEIEQLIRLSDRNTLVNLLINSLTPNFAFEFLLFFNLGTYFLFKLSLNPSFVSLTGRTLKYRNSHNFCLAKYWIIWIRRLTLTQKIK